MNSLGAKNLAQREDRPPSPPPQARLPPHRRLGWPAPHLARVQPVLQLVAPSDARQCQVVEDVLTQGAEQSTTQTQTCTKRRVMVTVWCSAAGSDPL